MLTAFVLGPLVTTLAARRLLLLAETWIYPVRVTLLFPFGAGLPGVFEDNMYAGAVNGPLWSLPVEVFAYLLLFLLGITGLLRDGRSSRVAVAGLAWAAVWVPLTSDAVGSIYVRRPSRSARRPTPSPTASCWPGRSPCCCSGLRRRRPGPTSVRVVVWTLAAVYLSYWFAYALPPIGRAGQQARRRVVRRLHLGVPDPADPGAGVVDSPGWYRAGDPGRLALAYASWHFVERPSLRHKPRPSATV